MIFSSWSQHLQASLLLMVFGQRIRKILRRQVSIKVFLCGCHSCSPRFWGSKTGLRLQFKSWSWPEVSVLWSSRSSLTAGKLLLLCQSRFWHPLPYSTDCQPHCRNSWRPPTLPEVDLPADVDVKANLVRGSFHPVGPLLHLSTRVG